MQPHFLFNALNTISAFTETNPQVARRLMGQLGDLLRASLAHAARPLVTLGEELTFLDDYLAIESARFEGRLMVSVHVDDDLLHATVPGFLFQPLVENAIRHGIARHPDAGLLLVTAERAGDMLLITVVDDGVGIDPTAPIPPGHGIENTRERLRALYGDRASLEIAPRPEGGTIATLQVPYRELGPEPNDEAS